MSFHSYGPTTTRNRSVGRELMLGGVLALSAVLAGSRRMAVAKPLRIEGEDAPAVVNCTVATSSLDLDDTAQAMLAAINDYRLSVGLETVSLSPILTRAAVWKSEARAHGAPDVHDDEDRDWAQRLIDCGYDATARTGEIIAHVASDLPVDDEPAVVLDAWKHSPHHDGVLRDPAFQFAGLGRVLVGSGDDIEVLWTVDFGGPPDPAQALLTGPPLP